MLRKIFIQPKNLLILILLFTALSRLFIIWYPPGYVFDEVYHAFTAREFLAGHKEAWEWWTSPPPGVAYEWTHPPVAKELMATSMRLFQNLGLTLFQIFHLDFFSQLSFHATDAWAYRLPGVIMGIISVYLVYALAKKIFKDDRIALVSAFVFSIDGLLLVQSRTGMNDIYFVTFMLATLLFFLKNRFLISAIFLGLSLASKWTGFYLYGFIILLYFIKNFRDQTTRIAIATLVILGLLVVGSLKLLPVNFVNDSLIPFYINDWTHICLGLLILIYIYFFREFKNLGILILVPLITYLLTYLPFFLLGHDYKTFWGLQEQMWWYHSGLKATHDYSSPAWTWPLNLYPVWYFVDYHPNEFFKTIFGTHPTLPHWSNIFASGNPLMFILGFIAIIVSIWDILKNKFNFSKIFKDPILIPLLGYLVFFIPWFLSPRIMFLYHYSPSIPFMSLLLGYQIQKMAQDFEGEKILGHQIKPHYITLTILGLLLVSFLFIYPILIGAPLPKQVLLLFFRTNLTKNPFGWEP